MSDALATVVAYHERTKHRFGNYAASLGYMDWANQPDPFRSFAGSGKVRLDVPPLSQEPTYDRLFAGPLPAASIDRASISLFLHDALGLSAWKQAGRSRWSLRMNPSSGNLHPTEGYLLAPPIPGLLTEAGVYHYQPYWHALELRARLSAADWQALTRGLPQPGLLVGLTSIHWREVWKYGERGFRYCQHDVGHAIGTIALAAAMLGWRVRLLDELPHDELAALLGTRAQAGVEAETADCLLLVSPRESEAVHLGRVAVQPLGQPNVLSRQHHDWPVIEQVSRATHWPGSLAVDSSPRARSAFALPARSVPAQQIIRQRRSAVDMDGRTTLSREVFYHMLGRVMPGGLPFDVLPWRPCVSLALFVHRVDGLEPGLYLLVRDAAHRPGLASSLRGEFAWSRPPGCPAGLDLYLLDADDARQAARTVSCHQDIAADGAFALSMLAEFDAALARHGPAFYPRLFWETGLVGQVLYLEAEAAGIRATGIGCFFDDAMHEILGIRDRAWQSLYHFTVGGPVDDPRIQTLPPYAHL